MMRFFDQAPGVLSWASEPVKIPYRDPITGNQKIYIPDFLVEWVDGSGTRRTRLIEVKPMHEAVESFARNREDAAIRIRNERKWGAALQWAERRGIEFKVMTEADLYNNHKNRKGREHPIKARGFEQLKKANPKPPAKPKAKSKGTSSTLKASKLSKKRTRKTPSVPKVKKAAKVKKA